MCHPLLSAGKTVDFEEAHLRPAQAEAEADRIVDFLGGCDIILDEPEGLAPDRLEKPIGQVRIDLLAHV